MSETVLERTIKCCVSSSEHPIFTWHGGEPTLAGLAFFKKALDLMGQYRRPGQVITNAIQTNATRIDSGFAAFFKERSFLVGVSLDGPEKVHGAHRLNSAHRNSYSGVMKGVETLRKAGVAPSVICTVTRDTLDKAEEVFRFLLAQGFTNIKYSPVYDSTGDRFNIGHDEWFSYLRTVFDIWFENGDPQIEVRELDEVIVWLSNETLPLCSSERSCLRWVSVDPNGELYPCEYLKTNRPYGNILEMGFEDISNTPAYQRFREDFLTPPQQCQECQFYPLCGNGCPATRTVNGVVSPRGVYVYCQERRELYNYIKEHFDEALAEPQRGG